MTDPQPPAYWIRRLEAVVPRLQAGRYMTITEQARDGERTITVNDCQAAADEGNQILNYLAHEALNLRIPPADADAFVSAVRRYDLAIRRVTPPSYHARLDRFWTELNEQANKQMERIR